MKQPFSQIKPMRFSIPWIMLAIAAHAGEVPVPLSATKATDTLRKAVTQNAWRPQAVSLAPPKWIWLPAEPAFMNTLSKLLAIPFLSAVSADAADPPKPGGAVLREEAFRHYTEEFNKYDSELYRGYVPNAGAWEFLKDNIPLFECPDEDIQRTYYFRWWTFRKHLKQTPAGFIVDEFLPNVSWAGKYNSISCAAGHHLYEGRWLTVIWDRTGQHYGKGQGLRVVANGKEIAKSAKIGRVTGLL